MPLLHVFMSCGVGLQGGWFVGGLAVDGHPWKWCHHAHQTVYPFLLTSVWGMGTLVVIYTLETCCRCEVSVGVAMCSNWLGCVFICACVASAIHCRSFVVGECLSLPVMPRMALTQSANLCITLSACVMEGLVTCLCWNCTVSDRRLLLVCFMWQLCVQKCSGDVKRYHPSTE